MKTFTVHAHILNNGVSVTTKVQAEDKNEAELTAGRKFLEAGFKGKDIKIDSID